MDRVGQARETLARHDRHRAARAIVQTARANYEQARSHLEATILGAHEAGVPQTVIAADSGFSRQWVRHLLMADSNPEGG